MRTSSGIAVALVAIAAAIGACAPAVDGPLDHQRTIDRDDSVALSSQLALLPGVVHATVTLHRPMRDPLAVTAQSAASAGVLIVVDDGADRASVTTAAAALVQAAAPEITHPAILVEVGAHRAMLAKVGPFTVEESSRAPLRAVLAIAFVLIAGLAGWIALRYRRGNSAQ